MPILKQGSSSNFVLIQLRMGTWNYPFPYAQFQNTRGYTFFTALCTKLDKSLYHTGIEKLVQWYDKCLNLYGDYVEKWA